MKPSSTPESTLAGCIVSVFAAIVIFSIMWFFHRYLYGGFWGWSVGVAILAGAFAFLFFVLPNWGATGPGPTTIGVTGGPGGVPGPQASTGGGYSTANQAGTNSSVGATTWHQVSQEEDIAEIIRHLKNGSNLAKQVAKLYEEAEEAYKAAKSEVIKNARRALQEDLDAIYETLNSENLKELLKSGKLWEAQEIIVEAINFGENIKQAACYDDSDEPQGSGLAETELEKAYKILHLQEDATDEEIEIVHRKLAIVFHPDAKNVRSDESVKDINWAYQTILRSKKKEE